MLAPNTIEGITLFLDGSLALAEVEAAGLKVDEGYLERVIQRTRYRIKINEKELFKTAEGKLFKKMFPTVPISNRNALAEVLEKMKVKFPIFLII